MSVDSAVSTQARNRELVGSDNPLYRQGQGHRENHELNREKIPGSNRPRPKVDMLRQNSQYHQGYYGDALQQNLEGYLAKVVKKGPKPKPKRNKIF